LLDPPEMVPYSKIKDSPEPWNTDKDRAVSKQMALESVVLLKNEKNFLPLDKMSIKSIAVIGPLADSVHWDWYGGTPPYASRRCRESKGAGPDVKVNYAADELGNAAVERGQASDVAVVVVGNDPTCGPDMAHDWHNSSDGGGTLPCTVPSDGREGRDRESIDLAQEQLVKQVYAVNPKTVVILVSSFPFAINWSQANVPAILHMAHASQDEGTALAQGAVRRLQPGRPPGGNLAEVSRSVAADDGLQHPRRPHLHVLQRRAAVSVRLRPELHDVQVLQSPHQFPATGERRNGHRQRGRDEYRQPRGR
jgi:beta-glucosidase